MRVAVVVAVLGLAAAGVSLALLQRERARTDELMIALAQAKQAQAQSEDAAASCKHSSLSNLGRAFTAAMSAKGAPSAPTDGGVKHATPDAGTRFEDLPPEKQASMFDALDGYKRDTSKKLADLKQKLQLSPEQDKLLGDRIEAMNHDVVAAADRLLALLAKSKDPPPRQLIAALGDGLDALRGADQAFRDALDDQQRAALDADGFDLTSQIDPLPLMTRAIAFAPAAGSSVSVGVDPDKPDK